MVLFYLSLFTCILMNGMMWFLQIMHYPSFKFVDQNRWVQFNEKRHMNTSMIQFPIMIFELGSSLILFLLATQSKTYPFLAAATGLLFLIWIWTFLMHNKTIKVLEKEYSDENLHKVIKSNWVRTVAYALRLFLLLCSIFFS